MTARLRVVSRIAAKSRRPKISDLRMLRVGLWSCSSLIRISQKKKQTEEKEKVPFEQLERKQKSEEMCGVFNFLLLHKQLFSTPGTRNQQRPDTLR